MGFAPCNDKITVEHFLGLINEWLHIPENMLINENIIDSNELACKSQNISRSMVAKILYGISASVFNEEDIDWSAALELKDIYACRSCVKYIAQVYAKGIMDAAGEDCFGLRDEVSLKEATGYLERLQDVSLRRVPPKRSTKFIPISRMELKACIERAKDGKEKPLVIDVRSQEEYNSKPLLGQSNNIPLEEIIQNPYCMAVELSTPVYLICEKGYKSAVVAEFLSKHGYRNVYYMFE